MKYMTLILIGLILLMMYIFIYKSLIKNKKTFFQKQNDITQKKMHAAKMSLYASFFLVSFSLFLLFTGEEGIAWPAALLQLISMVFAGYSSSTADRIREEQEYKKRPKAKIWWEEKEVKTKNEKPE